MTPLQQTWLARAVVLLVLFGLAWLVFAPGNGLLALYSRHQAAQALQGETELLQKDNANLQGEIDKMRNDPAHLEEVARRDFGLLKSNERVYDFADKTEDKD